MRVALLEDDTHQAEVMQLWLEAAGHACNSFPTGKAFLASLAQQRYDLVVLDWVLPDTSGIEILQQVRSGVDWRVPVIFVTQKGDEKDVVLALEQGADDYMTKPVKPLEMLARITALGRRALPPDEHGDSLNIGGYRLDSRNRTIEHHGQRVELTHKEFDLALFLLRNIGRLLSRGEILVSVWGTAADLATRTVDTHISRVRNKLALRPENGWKLTAVYQHGYRLVRVIAPEAGSTDAGDD